MRNKIKHPRVRFQSFADSEPRQRTIEILPEGVGDFPVLYFCRCWNLYVFIKEYPIQV